jgi:hypothetical protein
MLTRNLSGGFEKEREREEIKVSVGKLVSLSKFQRGNSRMHVKSNINWHKFTDLWGKVKNMSGKKSYSFRLYYRGSILSVLEVLYGKHLVNGHPCIGKPLLPHLRISAVLIRSQQTAQPQVQKHEEIWNSSWLKENNAAGQARTKPNYWRTLRFVLKITVLKFSAWVVTWPATVLSATQCKYT